MSGVLRMMIAKDRDAIRQLAARVKELELERDAALRVRFQADNMIVVPEDRLLRAHNRITELSAALAVACDVAVWMTGSESFSPGGEAHEGWLKMRERLWGAMAALRDGDMAAVVEAEEAP